MGPKVLSVLFVCLSLFLQITLGMFRKTSVLKFSLHSLPPPLTRFVEFQQSQSFSTGSLGSLSSYFGSIKGETRHKIGEIERKTDAIALQFYQQMISFQQASRINLWNMKQRRTEDAQMCDYWPQKVKYQMTSLFLVARKQHQQKK